MLSITYDVAPLLPKIVAPTQTRQPRYIDFLRLRISCVNLSLKVLSKVPRVCRVGTRCPKMLSKMKIAQA